MNIGGNTNNDINLNGGNGKANNEIVIGGSNSNSCIVEMTILIVVVSGNGS